MQPRIHALTLAVDDLERALRFYRDGLGLETEGIIGIEFAGDDRHPSGRAVMFKLQGGLILALYSRSDVAKDANVGLTAGTTGDFTIGHAVADRGAVDDLLARAKAAGATLTDRAHERPWGIYSSYFRDPDGHLWEIMWNPGIDPDAP